MLNDRDFDKLSQPIIEIYGDIEKDLLRLIASRFNVYEEGIQGSMEWWIKKLDEIGGLNTDAVKVISKYSKKSETEIKKMLSDAGYNSINMPELMDVYAKGGTLVNPKTVNIARIIENSYKQVNETFQMINTKAVESTKKAYMDALNRVYLEVSNGVYDYNTAINRATQKMADNGIKGATYKRNDGTLVNYSLESTVRRDTVTAINQLANKTNEHMATELGANHYAISEHLGARNKGTGHENHEKWQGIVTQIVGSTKEYPNHVATTGDGLVDGLGGVNCRHHKWAFFPGISVMPKKLVDDVENSRIYELTQKQRSYEHAIRHWKKREAVSEEVGNEKDWIKSGQKIKEYQAKVRDLVKENPELRRQYSREKTSKKPLNVDNHIIATHDLSDFGAVTNDIVLLPERKNHIMKRHPQVLDTYKGDLNKVFDKSELVLKSNDKADTLMYFKKYDDKYLQTVLRINTDSTSKYKNSIITMFEVKDSRIRRLLKKSSIVIDKRNNK
ncbi:phage minor capsid protein [Breznakia sp. OttesenSCG-928-G09]|nr:phage minor capsid protein [Breznakia sp. OttesenSCG-928-G09]